MILILLATKCTHNFSIHLSRVATQHYTTLYILALQQACCFPVKSVGGISSTN